MITPYTITNARQLTGRIIKKLEIWARCIFVTFENGQTRFLSKAKFWELFHKSRKERGQDLYISHYRECVFQVQGYHQDYYFVEADKSGVWCECRDFEEQKKIITNPICKHGWRTLNYLGFDSLSDYIKSGKYYSLLEG